MESTEQMKVASILLSDTLVTSLLVGSKFVGDHKHNEDKVVMKRSGQIISSFTVIKTFTFSLC